MHPPTGVASHRRVAEKLEDGEEVGGEHTDGHQRVHGAGQVSCVDRGGLVERPSPVKHHRRGQCQRRPSPVRELCPGNHRDDEKWNRKDQ